MITTTELRADLDRLLELDNPNEHAAKRISELEDLAEQMGEYWDRDTELTTERERDTSPGGHTIGATYQCVYFRRLGGFKPEEFGYFVGIS